MKFKNYVKRLIRETMISTKAASSAGLVLFKMRSETGDTELVLFDTSNEFISDRLEIAVSNYRKEKDKDLFIEAVYELNFYDQIVGMITLQSALDNFNDCDPAKQIVAFSAAKKGYGPLLYDYALSMGWTTSDRRMVKPRAKAVWDFYFHSRKDVHHEEIDVDGDCAFQDGTLRNPISKADDSRNFAYRLNDDSKFAKLERDGSEFLRRASGGDASLKRIVMTAITSAAANFFEEMYNES